MTNFSTLRSSAAGSPVKATILMDRRGDCQGRNPKTEDDRIHDPPRRGTDHGPAADAPRHSGTGAVPSRAFRRSTEMVAGFVQEPDPHREAAWGDGSSAQVGTMD